MDQHKEGIAFSDLPRTFQDVVQITRSLGIRYIWIDSLCIIQDNKEDWADESSKMANIYENCYLNISATGSSDSSGGCFGDRWLTNRARVYPQKFEFDPWTWTITNLPLSIRINSQPIHLFIRPSLGEAHRNFLDLYPDGDSVITAPLHRGWDFQERVLSPRTIHFHSAELIWECRAGDHCECGGIISDPSDLRGSQSFLKKLYSAIESVDSQELQAVWLTAVNSYVNLNLTYDSDRLPAFSGIAGRSQRLLGERKYLAGIWDGEGLARALLWDVYILTPRNLRSSFKDARLPSWSWVAGQTYGGEITYAGILHDEFIADPLMELVGAECELQSANPFGEVACGKLTFLGRWIDGVVVKWSGVTQRPLANVTLIIDSDIEDMILISRFAGDVDSDFDLFAEGEERLAEGQVVRCLHLGKQSLGSDEGYDGDDDSEGASENAAGVDGPNRDLAESNYLNMGLLLKPCVEGSDVWERLGLVSEYDTTTWNHGTGAKIPVV